MATRCTDPEVDDEVCTLRDRQRSHRIGPSGLSRAERDLQEECAPGLVCAVAIEPSAYGSLIHRIQGRLEREEVEAVRDRDRVDHLFDELMKLAPAQREEALAVDPRFSNFFLCDRLLDTAERLAATDRAASNELVFLGLAASTRLDPARCGRSLIADLEARAWALMADGWLESGASDAGQTALRLARSHLREGSGDPLEEAEILFREAGAHHAQRPAEALDAVDRAAAIFLEYGERRRLGDSLVRKAELAADGGAHRTAVPLFREALALLHGRVPDRRLAEIGWRMTRSLLAEGAADEAWTEIARARTRLRSAPDDLLEARLRFLEGRIALLAGLDDEAETCLREARDTLLREGRPEEAARAHLGWVALSCRRARPDRSDRSPRGKEPAGPDAAVTEALAAETDRLLASAGLSRETVMVLLLVDRAASSGTLKPDLVDALDDFLERSA